MRKTVNFEYIVAEINGVENGIEILNYSGSDSDVVIPSKIDGKPVTVIGPSVFGVEEDGSHYGRSHMIKHVIIPNSVIEIDNSAFDDCTELTHITIPDSVTKIGERAFACSGLTHITIPDGVTEIGDDAFGYCTNLTSIDVGQNNKNYTSEDGILFNKDKTVLIKYPSVKAGTYSVPNTVTKIEHGAFYECAGLTGITIPNSVTTIGASAFKGCTGLKWVTIPDSITEIKPDTFSDCTALNEVHFFGEVTEIGDYAFRNCTSLTSINVPDTVKRIGEYAFYNCRSLTTVDIELRNNKAKIESFAFSYCTALSNVRMPKHVTVDESAFSGCCDSMNIRSAAII